MNRYIQVDHFDISVGETMEQDEDPEDLVDEVDSDEVVDVNLTLTTYYVDSFQGYLD
ncbi:hypothetical protein [Salicibibacter kimchii]|uniref:hypothetical protein n=1 Tax=Salicibibacter kimchii TaxID=2099786 RepID=UPI00135C702F|nr:hypothetical protein [Salicibibacter kimchii]